MFTLKMAGVTWFLEYNLDKSNSRFVKVYIFVLIFKTVTKTSI